MDRESNVERAADARVATQDVSVRYARDILRAAARDGVAAEDLLRAAGVDPAAIEDPESRISHHVEMALWEEAAHRTGDPFFGLHVGERFVLSSFGPAGHLAMASANLGESFERIVRYSETLHRAMDVRFEVRSETAHFTSRLGVAPWVTSRHSAECGMAAAIANVRRIVGRPVDPVEVCFQHGRPADVSEHVRIFRCPIRFGRSWNELVLDRAVLDEPVRSARPSRCPELEAQAAGILARLGEPDGFLELVSGAIFDSLEAGDLGTATVARRLGIAPATMRRKLAERSTSYRYLVAAIRRELALAYLQDESWTPDDVAFVLGFPSLLSFARAFKSWTGLTPREYRLSFEEDRSPAGEV